MTSHLSHPYSHAGESRNTRSLTPTRASVPFVFFSSLSRPIASVALLTAAACTSKEESARKQLEFLKANKAPSSEICVQARALVRAEVEEGDAEAYKFDHLYADTDCLTADLEQENGL